MKLHHDPAVQAIQRAYAASWTKKLNVLLSAKSKALRTRTFAEKRIAKLDKEIKLLSQELTRRLDGGK